MESPDGAKPRAFVISEGLMDYAALRARVARSNADTLIAAAFRKALGIECRGGVKPAHEGTDRYDGWFECFLNRERVRL